MNVIPIRRFVTADDDDGRSYAVVDEPTDAAFQQGTREVALTDMWRLSSVPAPLQAESATSDGFSLNPPKGGAVFRVVQFNPGSARTGIDGAEVFAAMGASGDHAGHPEHPFMHRTRTIDFGIILTGRITMVLDREQVDMVAGDVLVQRGTNHEWRNESDEPCLVAFILIAGE